MVSIIIPCYNHEKYVEDCLISICEQSYKDIELIVCDDCSSDKSFEIIKRLEPKLKERFTSVILEKNEFNLGICKTLNKMIKQSKGDYIKILASDDMLMPDAISELMDKVDGSDIYFSNVAIMPEYTKYCNININEYELAYKTRPLEGKNLTGELCGKNFIYAPGVIIPKNTYDVYGLYDEQYCLEDFEYWLRVSVNGKIKYVDVVTALYRDNNTSLSRFDISKKETARHRKFLKETIKIFYKYEKYANSSQVCQFYNTQLDFSIGANDIESIKDLKKEMKKNSISIDMHNKIRMMIVFMRVYPFLKKLKNKLR